ncbi:Hypothetical protein PMT_2795 [Prochlorococcus marinus str. MIT 9313]|uniref:Uncharacterized protein n=1 Tax=Prochlorococcus marinus (strain MIT 9313) TaxID=74547 RepID=B9ESG8_PROMM|nr:Hypothetical protein PMT_2795 [Prochlorococcus marinus str. MIT 9313]
MIINLKKIANDSAKGADHTIKIGSSFCSNALAVRTLTRDALESRGTRICIRNDSDSSGLHDLNSTNCVLNRHPQSVVGLFETIEATIIQNRCITCQEGVTDIAEDDLSIAQASSHAASGIAVTARLSHACVLANHAAHCIRCNTRNVLRDCIGCIDSNVGIRNVLTKRSQIGTAEASPFGISTNYSARECVKHWQAGQDWGLGSF